MNDPFFTKTKCDRCHGSLATRTMSWFTEETICMDCSDEEDKIKNELRQKGLGSMEGCGYVPKIEEVGK